MSATYALISIGGSPEMQRRQMNVNFGLLQTVAGYGGALPSPSSVLDGSLFVHSGHIYQNQTGSWVLIV